MTKKRISLKTSKIDHLYSFFKDYSIIGYKDGSNKSIRLLDRLTIYTASVGLCVFYADGLSSAYLYRPNNWPGAERFYLMNPERNHE